MSRVAFGHTHVHHRQEDLPSGVYPWGAWRDPVKVTLLYEDCMGIMRQNCNESYVFSLEELNESRIAGWFRFSW